MTKNVNPKKAGLPPIFYFLLGLILVFVGPKLWGMLPMSGNSDWISFGDRIVIADNPTPEKQEAIAANAKGDRQKAEELLQKSLDRQPNDPEGLIALDNLQTGENPLKIAAVIPANNPNVAREMLRGIASAQARINAQGGVNGRKIAIAIVNDDNKPEIAQGMADKLVKNSEIIAVIGHNASNASLAAAPVYEKGKLVMVSPTSFASNLSGAGDYIFRLVPKSHTLATSLAEQIAQTAKDKKIAFCHDSGAPDGVSFKDELMAEVAKKGGSIVPIVCDVMAPGFNPEQAVNTAISSGAGGLFVTAHIDRIERAIEVIRANRGRLALFGSPTLYNIKTLQQGGEDAKGLILVSPWHPSVNPAFATRMTEQWRGPVSWRTATSYDTLMAIAEGLKRSDTRQGLQSALRSSDFKLDGATGVIRFDSTTGDRIGQPVLLQVQSGPSGYQFAPLTR